MSLGTIVNGVKPGRSSGRPGLFLAILTPVIVVLCLFPIARLIFQGVWQEGAFSAVHLTKVLAEQETWRATWHSLFISAAGTIVSVLIGGVFAFLVALTDIRHKAALVFCFMLPMMIPPQITALSWLQMFGPTSAFLKMIGLAPPLGSRQPLYSQWGIALLLGIQHASLIFLTLRAALRQVPREQVEAARLAGAHGLRVWRDVILPITSPALIAGVALTFVTAIGNFGISAMLGIPANIQMLPTLIYSKLSSFGPSILSEVAVLAILIGIIAAVGVITHHHLVKGRDYRLHGIVGKPLDISLGRYRLLVEIFVWLVLFFILIVPLIALVSASMVPAYGMTLSFETATLDAFREVMFRQAATARAFVNSFGLSIGAALALFLLTVPLAYGMMKRRNGLAQILNIIIEIPYALPGIVLAIACILTFQRIPLAGISLYGTLGIIFIAYLARFFVVSLRPVVSSFQQMDPNLEEAAQACGASAARRLIDILLPAVAPSAAAGGLLVFLTAFNELTVSALLWSSGNETLGVIIFNLDDSGESVLASAVAVLVVVVIIALMGLIEFMGNRLPKGVIPWRS
ncbi:iron ABC transporter permease [uncultured Cohaesibacter sp.]|uniref:ABC transporter permease n=1 Tax=uncultured Cohaesibacter sp. TaxID=1002546 RepID=UPI00292F9472|nr:iron ABC transporter permease [uncultured Cohaesibacter sp.]